MPMDLSKEDQKLEIPYAYQDVVIEDAVAELLENNPEDSAEFKRSVRFEQKTDKSIAEYKRDTKPPLSGREMRVRTAVEGWQKNMEWRKGMF
jgi:hypothetical protein